MDNIDTFQEMTNGTQPTDRYAETLSDMTLGMAGATGAIALMIQQHLHGKGNINTNQMAALMGEMMYKQSIICTELGIEMSECLDASLKRLEKKADAEGWHEQENPLSPSITTFLREMSIGMSEGKED